MAQHFLITILTLPVYCLVSLNKYFTAIQLFNVKCDTLLNIHPPC